MVQAVRSPKKSTNSWFPWLICGLGTLFYTYEYFLRIAPNVMLPDLMRSFDIGSASVGNLIAFYYYAYSPAQLLVGVLMDHYGPRRILTIACLICAIGTYLFASTTIFPISAIGRFMMGFGSAFAFVGVLKLATIWLPPDRFALVSGLTSALGTVGASIGEIVLTDLVTHAGWRQTIMGAAAIGVVLAVLLLVFIRDGTPEAEELDARDSLSFTTILRGMWAILCTYQVWLAGIIGGLLYLPTSAFAEAWGKSYIETVHHVTSTEAAWVVSAIFAGFTFGAPINGLISDRMNNRVRPIKYGGILAAIVMSSILFIPNQPYILLLLETFLLGSLYSVQVVVFALGRESSPVWAAGSAIAVTNMVIMLGGVIFQPLIGKMLQMGWSGTMENGIPVYSSSDYLHAAYIFPIALVLASVLAFFVRSKPKNH